MRYIVSLTLAVATVFVVPLTAGAHQLPGSSESSPDATSSAKKPNFNQQRKTCRKFRKQSRVRICLKKVNRREKAWKRRNSLPTMTIKKATTVAKWAARKSFERAYPREEPGLYAGYWAGDCELTSDTAAQCEFSFWHTTDYGGGLTYTTTCEGLVDLWYVNRQTIRTDNHTVKCYWE
ncbi:MAG: hypothetical protein KC561_14065 [Myxococcales bacterium]|nr:hypothetical protein [Myxococcales bacterium]